MARYTARTADRHELYESAVQCVGADIDFAERIYRHAHGRRPAFIREDFCGTGAAAAEFVRRRPGNRALAVDLDTEVLAWGRQRAALRAGPAAERIEWLRQDVRTAAAPAEIVLALNFSYFVFATRADLGGYFAAARRALQPGGMLILDMFGGAQAQLPQEERRKCAGFTYVWEQHAFDPLTFRAVNYIHFEFPDGTRLPRAFRYDWRLWNLPEVRELLAEAGFARTDVYWEGWEADGRTGNGRFRRVERAENCDTWIAYLVAARD